MNTWPDAGNTPFRNEKNSSWEGAYRVPCMVRFPGRIAARSVSNEIISHQDWFPTILAVAGEPDIAGKLKKGHKIGDKTFKVHLDGYNLLPHLTGKEAKSPRQAFVYFTDDGDVAALRYDNWKVLFMEQRVHGTLKIWQDPFVTLRAPYIFNLRMDPYEHAQINVEHLLRLDVSTHLSARAGSGLYWGVPCDLQGVPTATEVGELQSRSGDR